MDKKIQYARLKLEKENERIIFCDDCEKSDYESKYKGYLKCINGCQAKIKFTQKKNNIKFFSTWNKQGKLHDLSCPYYVEYKGVKGREKLNAYYKRIELDDETIFRRLKRKYDDLHKIYNASEIQHPKEKGSMEIENVGEDYVDVSIDAATGDSSRNGSNIRYKDANYVTTDDLKSIISVYGKVKSAWVDKNKDGTKFAYINFDTEHTSVNILLSEAFYAHELSNGIEEFEQYIKKVQKLIDNATEPIEAIAYGEITKKRRNKGVNVSVITPNRILINNMSYREVILYGINNREGLKE